MQPVSGNLVVKIKRKSPDHPLPEYATPGSAGMDLRADEQVVLHKGEYASVGTGLYMEIPEGYEGQVRPRSGLAAKHGVTLLNAPGTIDSDYRGELRILLINHGERPFTVEPGDRIAQIVFAPVERAQIRESLQLSPSSRDSGGFGSTGMK